MANAGGKERRPGRARGADSRAAGGPERELAVEARRAAVAMAAGCLCFRARRVARALTRMYDEALRPLGVQATQLTLLNAVALWGENGAPMTPLADAMAMDLTTLSRNLGALAAARWVTVGRSDADRRVRIARLTPAGEALIAEALPVWTRAHEAVIAVLGREAGADLRDRFDAAVVAASGGDDPVRRAVERLMAAEQGNGAEPS